MRKILPSGHPITVNIVDHGVEREENESDRSLLRRQLQTVVIQHLNAGKKVDTALDFSLNFSIAQWVKDLTNEQTSLKNADECNVEIEALRIKRDHIHQMINYPPGKELELSYDDICIISRYLSKDRQFNKSFDTYLLQILSVSNEPAVQIRTKSEFSALLRHRFPDDVIRIRFDLFSNA